MERGRGRDECQCKHGFVNAQVKELGLGLGKGMVEEKCENSVVV